MRASATALPGSFERRDGFDCFVAQMEPTADDVEAFFDGLAVLRSKAEAAGQAPPFRMLVDCAGLKRLGAAGRAVTYRRKGEVHDWRIAVVGHTMFHRLLVEFLRIATGVRGVKYFTDGSEARDWLDIGGK